LHLALCSSIAFAFCQVNLGFSEHDELVDALQETQKLLYRDFVHTRSLLLAIRCAHFIDNAWLSFSRLFCNIATSLEVPGL
jgi:hypothetical protein